MSFGFWKWGQDVQKKKHAENRIKGFEELQKRQRDINANGAVVFLRKKAANKRKLF